MAPRCSRGRKRARRIHADPGRFAGPFGATGSAEPARADAARTIPAIEARRAGIGAVAGQRGLVVVNADRAARGEAPHEDTSEHLEVRRRDELGARGVKGARDEASTPEVHGARAADVEPDASRAGRVAEAEGSLSHDVARDEEIELRRLGETYVEPSFEGQIPGHVDGRSPRQLQRQPRPGDAMERVGAAGQPEGPRGLEVRQRVGVHRLGRDVGRGERRVDAPGDVEKAGSVAGAGRVIVHRDPIRSPYPALGADGDRGLRGDHEGRSLERLDPHAGRGPQLALHHDAAARVDGAARAKAVTHLEGEAGRERAPARDPETPAHAQRLARVEVTEKACVICGIGRERLRTIPVDHALAMDAGALEAQITRDRADGFVPCFVCTTLGTTSTGAVDPLAAIAPVARREDLWLHVDAAWAGSALVCPECRAMLEGIEHADSFSMNPHKWLLVNFDCSAFWVRGRERRLDLLRAMSVTPEYLRNAATESGAVTDYRDWHVPLGRRFRALKLWFVLRGYGAEGLRQHIRAHVRMAEALERVVRTEPRLEVAAPRALALLCVRVRGDDDAPTRRLLRTLNDTGDVFLTHTTVPADGVERFVIRVSIGGWRTEDADVRRLWRRIAEALDTLQ